MSRRPWVNAIIIAHQKDLTKTVDECTNDEDFATIYTKVEQGQEIPPYAIMDGFSMNEAASMLMHAAYMKRT